MEHPTKPNIFRYATFDVQALCCLASKLRSGRHCICDENQYPANGSLTWAVFLTFDDGVEWVLRSPRSDGAVKSAETNAFLLASEAATLKYLKFKSNIPVPEVFDYRYDILKKYLQAANISKSYWQQSGRYSIYFDE